MKEVWGIKKVIKGEEEKSYWTRLGVAHDCKDGSMNVFLDYFPANGNISLNIREKKQKDEAPGKGIVNGNDDF